MYAYEKKINRLFNYWLFISFILVFLIIIIGGLTRLTDSGLSITEWELFSGLLPPLNQNSWIFYFEEYKKIPQFKLLNNDMTLQEFKIIFYWEYLHRILARLIGLFFLIPLIFFYISKKINRTYLNNCWIIFFLIIFQGCIGWYMVKSGLVNDVTVSHYRLSIHLSIAFVIISSIFWIFKNFNSRKIKIFFIFSFDNLPFQLLILLLFIQIIFGAFVSGLDAGKIYQTWPLMGDSFYPDDQLENYSKIFFNFNDRSMVQFYHRILAYIVVIYSLFLAIYIYNNKLLNLYKPLKILILFLLLQVILGIFTLISGLNIYLASMHQITSVLLVLSALNMYYYRVK
jgi:cytochrome c oxidase assembly protein subunit 15